ncbi:DUF4238 domain-containing protein [Flavobacterium antarcticum]|uniref:DUF4238 domain-containing protein n=1 Tax=Flavobacterium antarcticum TaxID=271155 RepID=UPI0003B5A1D6|nr:DUF4238 domain-containing protein [Flavobacterium antarcticum]
MNVPLNHHYVSQVHLKNFFNLCEGKIFVYDKLKNNFFSKTTTKTLFSEKYLNSRFNKGNVEHESLENDLNNHFENDFSKHYQVIISFIEHQKFTIHVEAALTYFAKYGIIADMRTPRYKKQIDDSLFNTFNEITKNATTEFKQRVDEVFEFRKVTKYSNLLDYSKTADKILALMGNLIFNIEIPKDENDYYIIPDIAAATSRAKINKYFNPDIEEIAYIGIPLSSKIYIHFHSEKLFGKNKPDSCISYCNSSTVEKFNMANLDYSQSKIACESKEYLINFIEETNIQR